jgi:hypothetical protein
MNNPNYYYKYIKYKNKYNNLKGGVIKNIGFDFDGVIHKNVDKDDGQHSRNPKDNLLLEHRFEEIHNKIFDYSCYKHNIYIITGRGKRGPIFEYLNSCGLNFEIIPRDNINAIGGKGNKVDMAICLRLDEYYDDSTSEIQKFIDRKCEILVVNPNFRLFQTFPENSGREGAIIEIFL